MNQTVPTPAYAEYEFMNKAMNRINELIALCNQVTTERDQLQERVVRMTLALEKIIEMNRQQAHDQYGDPEKAEFWSCIRVARAALDISPA